MAPVANRALRNPHGNGVMIAPNGDPIHVRPFEHTDAAAIAGWVSGDRDLRWLAPGTDPPLTPDKVLGWKKPGGHPLALSMGVSNEPIGYAELNPMRGENGHLWLGHLLVRSDVRGRGIGSAFVRTLLDLAFDDLSADRVSLIVFPGNLAAINCYRRNGFKPVSEEYHRFENGGPKHRLLRLEARRASPRAEGPDRQSLPSPQQGLR